MALLPRARAGRHRAAATRRSSYAALASEATFFGFLAADKLDQPYAICPVTLAGDAHANRRCWTIPAWLRAFELYAVNLPG